MKKTQEENEENKYIPVRWKRVLQKKQKILFSHHILCVLNTSTLPWTRQKAFPTTTCLSAVSPEPPNHSELRSPVPPPESSYNEPEWGAAGLSQDHRLLSAIRSPLIRRHAPKDFKWKRILQMICWVLLINNYEMRFFVISRIIKVELGVISRSRRLSRLIILIKTLIVLDITKTKSNNCFIIHWRKKMFTKVGGIDNLFLNA